MEYQNIDAFLEMVSDPDYEQSLVHRTAGLEKTIVLVTRPQINVPIGGSLKCPDARAVNALQKKELVGKCSYILALKLLLFHLSLLSFQLQYIHY